MEKEGRILKIDLTKREISKEILAPAVYEKYPGGSSLGMYLMLRDMDPKVDPLSQDNYLIFSVSPLTGFPISGASRMCVTTKSPLTQTAGDSQVGGYIPAALAGNHWDAIIITGKAENPLYLYIDGEDVQLRDASRIWGAFTGEADRLIAEDLGNSNFESAIIGPAGENMVRFAAIMHRQSRANGRNGVGAVMGSKNLKALVVKKAKARIPFDSDKLQGLTGNIKERIEANPSAIDLGVNGSAGCLGSYARAGLLASRNWEAGVFEGWENITGAAIRENYLKKRETCFACAIRCKGVVEIPGRVVSEYGGPEYETCATFGSYCENSDLASICEANMLCNMYGLDTISCGAVIAFAMSCYEEGILKPEDSEGLQITFGNSLVIAPLIEKIGRREPGLGQLLSLGSLEAARILGSSAMKHVVACKGQEFPAHMPQMKPNLSINYAVNPFGADHQSSEHDPALMAPEDDQSWAWVNMLADFQRCNRYGVLNANKAKYAWETQKFYSMLDTLCLCQFVWGATWQLYGPLDLVTLCKAGADWDVSIDTLQEIGERRIVMMRLFNEANGFGKEQDNLPEKVILPMTGSDGEINVIDPEEFKDALNAYYSFAGWDPNTGKVGREAKERLGLDWVK